LTFAPPFRPRRLSALPSAIRAALPDSQVSLFIELLLARPDLADRVGIEV